MKIKFDSKTIEISKTFADKASRFGSEAYNELRMVMRDLPDFCVVIKAAAAPRRTYTKGLTYEYMESCIATVDEDGSIMRDFHCLRQGCNYAVVKKWFMTVLPEFNIFAA